MAGGEMFGGPVGTMNFNEDAQTRAQTQKILGEIAAQPEALKQKKLQTESMELELREERTVADILSRQASGVVAAGAAKADGTPKALSEVYGDLARMAAGSGAPNKAAEFAKLSGTLRSQESTATRNTALAELNTLKADRERIEFTSRLLDDVKDDESWNKAQLLYQAATGEQSAFAGLPYSPDLIKRLQDAGLTRKQQLDTRRQTLEKDSRDRARNNLQSYRDDMKRIAKEKLTLSQARETRLAKGGSGKGVVSPPKAEVDQAVRLLKGDFKDLADTDYLNAGYEIASEARALRQRNPALDANTAVQQAFVNAKARDDFKEIVEEGIFKDSTKRVFIGGGKTPETAISVPDDKAKLVKGRWYSGAGGVKGQWTGSGFKVNPEAPTRGAGALAAEDPDEEEEEAEASE